MRWIIRLVLAVVVLAGLFVGGLFLLPADKVAALVQDQVRSATGRELTLSGRLSPSLWPEIGVATGPVTLSNADWSDAGPMLAAEGLSVGLDLKALIGGQIVIREIVAQSPRIVLERAADGRANWLFETGAPAPETAGAGGEGKPARGFTLDMARVVDGSFVYLDRAAGTRTELAGVDATLAMPSADGPARIEVKAALNGQPLSATAQVAQLAEFTGGAVSDLSLDAALGGARLVFDGRSGLVPLSAEGAVDADLSDLRAIFAALGQPAPTVPGRQIGVKGQMRYTPQNTLHLREGVLRQDGNLLSGSADLALSGKPRLTGQFTAGALDLTALTGGGSGTGAGAGGGGGGGWSTAPIDLSGLGALDAEVTLAAQSVDLGGTRLGPTRIAATLTDRRLVLDLREVQAHGGRITGNVVLNGRGGTSVGGDLTVAGVAMQTLLRELADYDRLIGQGDLRLQFLGSGGSMAAIMNSLSGSGSLRLGKGELRGLDIAGMIRTLDLGYVGEGAKTIFDGITASFTIDQGVLRNDDMVLAAPLLTATGAGRVGIGARTLDYRVVSRALSDSGGAGGIRVPLLISGSWANPRYRLDLEAIARERLELDEQKKAIEEKARAAAKKAEEDAKARAARELGVEAGEGARIEDAARRKLEEEAKKGLRRLLGGN
ncbi:AsmA family protein [Rhodovulum strictum]|uniref:AsmA family protein n=1 Tax=Rhodovulum strictum TaxID=58314 RepID=A0A844B0E5_9RHOB|nr:AsmA family protein [Rhodovulum strictum]MRH19601.1 AsmA family protein [Rhodovulum strictum]